MRQPLIFLFIGTIYLIILLSGSSCTYLIFSGVFCPNLRYSSTKPCQILDKSSILFIIILLSTIFYGEKSRNSLTDKGNKMERQKRKKRKRCRQKNREMIYTTILTGTVVFFISTNSLELLLSFPIFFFKIPFTIINHWIFRCRSPTAF